MIRRMVILFVVVGLASFLVLQTGSVSSQSPAKDPGVRGGVAGAGDPFADLTPNQLAFFQVGKEDFEEEETASEGLGPRMNLDSCVGCHSQPAVGGTSPAVNPQVAFASKKGATNALPSFITSEGPAREAR